MRDELERLRDILDSIAAIRRYAARGKDATERDEPLQVWFVRHRSIIGEAVRVLPSEVRELAPEIPWSKIVGMRHALVHGYFDVDIELVWQVIERDIDPLEKAVNRILDELQATG